MNLRYISRKLSLLSLIFFACFAFVRAQTTPNITTFVCTEPVYANGAQTLQRSQYGQIKLHAANNKFGVCAATG